MSAKKNPFVPRPKSFFGRSARLKTWEGGFHTAKHKALAVPYAQLKWETSVLKKTDFPVILTLDMTGLPMLADIDARRACMKVAKGIGTEADESSDEEHKSMDEFLSDLQFNVENGEVDSAFAGQKTIAALFDFDSPSVDQNAFRDTLWFFEKQKTDESYKDFVRIAARLSVNEKARLSPSDEKLLCSIYNQMVYWVEVPDERIVAVEYMQPYYEEVVDLDNQDDWDEDTAEPWKEAEEQGYQFINAYDTDTPMPVLKQAWKRKSKGMPLFPRGKGLKKQKDQRIEYHGTSLANLLSVCPWLAAELPEPPKPQEGGIAAIRRSAGLMSIIDDTLRDRRRAPTDTQLYLTGFERAADEDDADEDAGEDDAGETWQCQSCSTTYPESINAFEVDGDELWCSTCLAQHATKCATCGEFYCNEPHEHDDKVDVDLD